MIKKICYSILSLALVMVLCLSLMAPAMADDDEDVPTSGTCGDNLTWNLDEKGTLTVTGKGAMWDYSYGDAPWYPLRDRIDRVVIGEGVTSVGDYAFYYSGFHARMKEIELPHSLTSIGRGAFIGCAMKELSLPDNLKRIGACAFQTCAYLIKLEIPGTVSQLGEWQFNYCRNLREVVFQHGISEIGNAMFYVCNNLTRVVIPSTVTIIAPNSFYKCEKLAEIDYGGTLAQWQSLSEGVDISENVQIHTKDPTFPVTVTDGTAEPDPARPGETVTVTAEKKSGYLFGHWSATQGNVVFEDEKAESTTFVMPNSPVSVEAIFLKACEICNGKGRITYHHDGQICLACGGSGKVHKDPVTCPYCSGKGQTSSICSECHGKGYIRKPYTGSGVPTIVNGTKYLDVACGNCNQTGRVLKMCTKCLGRGVTGGKTVKCSDCGGDGIQSEMSTSICPACHGDGISKGNEEQYEGSGISVLVRFDVGSHGTAPEERFVEDGQPVARPDDPTEDGWVFDGWYTDKALTKAYDFSTPVTLSMTLYAKWTEQPPAPTPTVTPSPTPTAAPAPTPTPTPALKNPFTDVAKNQYYYDPVLWAVNHTPQITAGTSETTFSPAADCTRGQVVTFLWRASGCPEPKGSNPFKDVKPADYFYKAVLWASELGITAGTSRDAFSPTAPCTRAHVVTFLWRMEHRPSGGTTNPFKDVPARQYYTDAVLWAVKNNITAGTSKDTFSPGSPCTRGQIVTFLYRDMT